MTPPAIAIAAASATAAASAAGSAASAAMPAAVLTAATLAELNLQRQAGGGAIWPLLEERLGLTPGQALAQLGRLLHMATLDIDALRALRPDFSLLSYAEAVRRRCLVARGAGPYGAPVCVTVDPYDAPLQSWVEAQLPRPPRT